MLVKLKFFFIFSTLLFASCGTQNSEVHKKKYVLHTKTTPEIKAKLVELISSFNYGVGYNVLVYSDDATEANSPITITPGLLSEDRDHDGHEDRKVGWGNWYTEKSSTRSLSLAGTSEKTTVHYGMELEFDKEYVEQRIALGTKAADYDLKKLFYHEVGHGLMMGHNEADQHDLMYPNIAGTKDFEKFFAQVREFFEQD